MLHRILGGSAMLAATGGIASFIAGLQVQANEGSPRTLWTAAVVLFVIAAIAGVGWWLTRPNEQTSPTQQVSGSPGAVQAGRDATLTAVRDMHVGATPALPVERGQIVLTPEVVADEEYGPDKDEKAFYVRVCARSADGVSHPESQGQLVSLTPLTSDPKIMNLPRVPSGLLQWAPLSGGAGQAMITRGGARLDVIALENSDHRGVVVYLMDEWRDRGRIDLDLAPLRAVVEVTSADGTSEDVTFDIFRGENGSSSLVIQFSRMGTLYAPRVEVVSSSPSTARTSTDEP